MFNKIRALKQVYKTITSTKPKTTKAGKKKIELLKKLGSDQKKIGIDKYKKMGGNKLANEVLNVDKKAKGGRIGYKGGKLVGGQKKIDVAAPFGKITGEDFKKLRNKKKVI